VLGAILGLVAEPYPPNSTAMRDGSGRRLRVGDYRVVYRVEGDDLYVHTTGHRSTVYDT
jgi:mRNA interferase RelE/StbE